MALRDASFGGRRRDRTHDRVASAAAAAIVSPQVARNTFEPVFQKTNRTIATLARLIVIVSGTSRVIAPICLARMQRISRSLRSLVSNPVPANEPRSQRTNAA